MKKGMVYIMKCSICAGKVRVIDNVNKDSENYRKRKCDGCGRIFYTIEFEVEQDDQFNKDWSMYHRKNNK